MIGLGYLLGLCVVIISGSVLPVVPTGAAVSVAAALAEQDDVLLIVLVVAFGAAGAYIADLGTYGALRYAGRRATTGTGRLSHWLHKQREAQTLDRVQHQIQHHELRTLLLSRLVPGGQIPILLAAALGGYPWRRYAVADIGAATLWSAMYATSGLAGRAVFSKPWEGAVAGISLVLGISAATTLCTRRRGRPIARPTDGSASTRVGRPTPQRGSSHTAADNADA